MLGGRHRRLGSRVPGRSASCAGACTTGPAFVGTSCSTGSAFVGRSRTTAPRGPTRRAWGASYDERAVLLLFVALDDRGAKPFLLVVVRVVRAVPEVVAVVLVGGPAAILFIVVVVGRTAPTAIAKIIDVVVAIGESELVVHFVTARHHRLLWR
jgi:hypothetical protein